MTLKDLKEGDWAQIVRVRGRGPFRRRLMEMGFVPGEAVYVEKYAPLRDPIDFLIMGYHVSLRIEEADMVEVTTSPVTTGVPWGRRGGPKRGRRGRGWRRR